jgi:hypothetical protein
MPRITFEPEFDIAVSRLGGYVAIAPALDPVLESLRSDATGFAQFDSILTSFRYAITERIPWTETHSIDPLVIVFTIDADGDAHLQHIERAP